jgi:hypothetical protein
MASVAALGRTLTHTNSNPQCKASAGLAARKLKIASSILEYGTSVLASPGLSPIRVGNSQDSLTGHA